MSTTQMLPPPMIPGHLPPDYFSPLDDPSLISFRTDELPAYMPPAPSSGHNRAGGVRVPEPKEFHTELKKKDKAIATLTLIADGSLSKTIPTYVEGQKVTGRVRLSLDKPDAIQSIVVVVRGQVITGANPADNLTFLEISRVPWSQTDGEPLNTSSEDGNSSPAATIAYAAGNAGSGSQSPKFTGKLQGEYAWPFSVELPKEVVVLPAGAKSDPQTFTLPQTFNERHTRASISYEVWVQFTRGKLRTDHRIASIFGYIPLTRPPPFPPLRRLAYQEGTTLMGPTIDPEGWFSPEPTRIRGTVFNNRAVQVKCTLFLANPLSYTRGSVLPLCLRLESADDQALDLLSSPKAIVLRLRRRIKYHWNAEKTMESLAWKDAIDDSQLAVWWPSTEDSQDPTRPSQLNRFINGELHLRADIKPTSSMAHFRIEYTVVLLPFDAPGFSSEETEPLLEHLVDIVTAYAPGPRPRMSAPPGYESDVPIISQNRSYARGAGFI